jgi:hypothetical protein
MDYDKAKHTVIYKKDGERYKLCKIFFGNDGSYYVTSPYHPAEAAVLFKATVNYAMNEMDLSLEHALDVAAAEDDEKRIKLSHHPDGFLQFSGQGIVSGKDHEGNIRGIGVMSCPLDRLTRRPAFGLTMAGLEDFEKPDRVKDIPCVFRHEELTPIPGPHVFVLEGYYLPTLWRRFVRVRPDGTRVVPLVHPAGVVIELKAIFPSEQCARQNFFGLEIYTVPRVEGDVRGPAFTISGSTGNLRENEHGQLLGDGIWCRYPRDFDAPNQRSLDYAGPRD